MTERTLTTESGPLGYHLLGVGPPRVALVPGWGLNGVFLRVTGAWAPLTAWAERWPLLVLDRRGAGLSRANTGPVSAEQLAADLVAALDDCDAGPVTLWAHADGALAAFALCGQGSGRVTRLVAQTPFARLLAGPDLPVGMDLRAMMALAALDRSAPVLGELDRLGNLGATEDAYTRFVATLAPGLMPRLVGEVAAVDARPLLPSISLPTLVVHGGGGETTLQPAGDLVASLLPHAQLAVIPELGWLPTPDQVVALLARIDDLLSSSDPTTP